ncbi:SecDF P1 head subdomain-containing protein [Pantoea agglomerans]|uniref:Insecticidal toxin complex protein tccz n=1 Tax=Enterobacter agglomerans TaxID=549 RepID=A0ACC5RKP4_ENTAG|nr:Insecticidal toxin complex protein tccz [Pantoea agglomerans]MBK4725281.1 Insecticidal toxin complex protein tccz [Pantoea agglomerans]
MYIKSGALLIVALIPLTSVAAKGDFDFSVSGEHTSFDSGCVKSVQYVETDEVGNENIIMNFTDECGKTLSTLTRQNIGKQMTIAYNGNKLTSAVIASRLSTSFRISAKEIPRVLLMKIFNDYETVIIRPE